MTPADKPDLPAPAFINGYSAVQLVQYGEAMRRKALESVAVEWDGCIYQAPGQDIDIGAAIRALIEKEPTT